MTDRAEPDSGLLGGRRAIVTGGRSGIGARVVSRFAELGAKGVALDLPVAAGGSGSDSLPSGWSMVEADVRDEIAMARAVAPAVSRLGGLDAVVAAAGVVPTWRSPSELDLDDLDRVLAVNVRGVAATVKLTAAHLPAGGTIVAVGSLNSWRGDPNIAAYAASKHAVLGLVRSAAMALGPAGVRVNAVAPGPIATDALLGRIRDRAASSGVSVADALSRAAADTVLGRIATVEEVTDAVVFLSSELASATTGQLLRVDGGIL